MTAAASSGAASSAACAVEAAIAAMRAADNELARLHALRDGAEAAHDSPDALASLERHAVEAGIDPTLARDIIGQGRDMGRASARRDGNSAAPAGDNAGKPRPRGGKPRTADTAGTDAEIARLAALSQVAYERERKTAAYRLGMRASALDKLVDGARAQAGAGDSKQGQPLTWPELDPWPHKVDGAALLTELAANIRCHVVMPDYSADAAALWTVHTYCLDHLDISPRLAVTSPERECGKTRTLRVLSRLVWRPLPTDNITPSMVFRTVAKSRPTLLIDEAENFVAASDELRGILNSSHHRGSYTIRGVGDDYEPRMFSTYCTFAIALIGKLHGTLASRSIPIELRRRRADEPAEPFRFDRTGHLDTLARKAARWTADNRERIRDAEPDIPPDVFNRAGDNWRPLLAIADLAGGEWPERACKAALKCIGALATADDSVRVRLLSDIRVVFVERRAELLSSAELVEALTSLEGSPWPEWKGGKPLTANGLARLLAPFGVAPVGTIRIGDRTAKGYRFGTFADVFSRYLPPVGGIEPSQRHNADGSRISATFATVTPNPDVTVAKSQKPLRHSDCDGVTVQKGEGGANSTNVPPREPPAGRRRMEL